MDEQAQRYKFCRADQTALWLKLLKPWFPLPTHMLIAPASNSQTEPVRVPARVSVTSVTLLLSVLTAEMADARGPCVHRMW